MADDLVVRERVAYIEAHLGELDIPDVEWLLAQLRAMTAERDELRRANDTLAEIFGGEETAETKNYEIVDVAELQAKLATMTAARDDLLYQQSRSKTCIERLNVLLAASEAALRKYGQHEQGCPVIITPELCNCGLTEALAEPGD